MAGGRASIGVDLGGTKLLAGAVDAGLARPPPRAPRRAGRSTPATLLDALADAVEEAARAVGGEVAAVGFGIPCADRPPHRRRPCCATHLPLAACRFAAI